MKEGLSFEKPWTDFRSKTSIILEFDFVSKIYLL